MTGIRGLIARGSTVRMPRSRSSTDVEPAVPYNVVPSLVRGKLYVLEMLV
ncbi:MAG: hypothetical protein GYA24_22600 [Candidatus Lokiarchaeota archaeon]|nr:hypothetical protein [Candidatus Lokiarchaeota archaeon]